MEEKKNKDIIDLRVLLRQIAARKRLFLITLPIAFVLSSLYILCIPRYYDTDVRLAPEAENTISGGALGSLAASFGLPSGKRRRAYQRIKSSSWMASKADLFLKKLSASRF